MRNDGDRTGVQEATMTVYRKRTTRRKDPRRGTYLQDGGYRKEPISRDWKGKDSRSKTTRHHIPIPVNKENKSININEGGKT